MKLYEISERYQSLARLLENEENMTEEAEGLIVKALAEVEDEFADKARNIARFIQNLKAEEDAIIVEIDRLEKKQMAVRNKRKRLKEYVEREMLLSGIDKITDPVLPLALRKAPPSVEVEPGAVIPEKYLIQQEPKVDKRGLLEALKAGEEIAGVRLVDDKKYLKIG